MSRRKKHRTNWKVAVDFSLLERLALAVMDGPTRVLTEGYSLQKSSGLWRKADGTLTARLVYRGDASTRSFSLVVTVRNIVLPREVARD